MFLIGYADTDNGSAEYYFCTRDLCEFYWQETSEEGKLRLISDEDAARRGLAWAVQVCLYPPLRIKAPSPSPSRRFFFCDTIGDMKILATHRESDIFPERALVSDESWGVPRRAVRGIVFREDGKIALNYYPATSHNGYMIPGGGVDEGEEALIALAREMHEEVGCSIKNVREVGTILEFGAGRKKQHAQTTDIFIAECDQDLGLLQMTDDEKELGLEVRWLTLEEALVAFEKQGPSFVRSLALVALAEVKRMTSVYPFK